MKLTATQKRLARARATELDVDSAPALILGAADLPSPSSQRIKIGGAGWAFASTTFYLSPEVAARDAGVFAAGTQMFLDHPTDAEMAARPEGSMRDLVGVLAEPAIWDDAGEAGPGLYARAEFLPHWADFLAAAAPISGLSMRMLALAHEGTIDGTTGQIIDSIVAVESVDVVTKPALDGKIIRAAASFRETVQRCSSESAAQRAQQLRRDSGENLDAHASDLEASARGDTDMNEKDQAELEAARKEIEDLKAKDGEWTDKLARAEQALAMGAAASVAALVLADSKLPDASKARVIEAAKTNPPIVEGKLDEPALRESVSKRADEEAEYLKAAVGHDPVRVEDAGSGESSNDRQEVDLEAAFASFGLDENAAKIAAKVRS